MSQIETRIAGIPAIVRYSIEGYHFPQTETTPEEFPDVVMEICDRRGRLAPWLEKKLTDAQWFAIAETILEEQA